MTPEQKAAFVVAQAALLNARIAAMNAANANRAITGLSPAYDEGDFAKLESYYEGALGWNAVITLFGGEG